MGYRMLCFIHDFLNAKCTPKFKTRPGSQSTMHKIVWVAGCSLLAFILDEMYEEHFANKINSSFMTEKGKLCLWMIVLASACYIGSQYGKRKQGIFKSNRKKRKESSNGEEVASDEHSR